MKKLKIYLKAIAVPVIIGLIIGFITSNSIDYNELAKPPFSPPGGLFPVIWTILYVLMGVSFGLLRSKNLVDDNVSSVYYAQLFVNSLWSIFFFTLKWRLFSFIWILILAALVLLMVVRFYRKNKVAGLLQIPYLVWVVFASYLNLGVYLLNR